MLRKLYEFPKQSISKWFTRNSLNVVGIDPSIAPGAMISLRHSVSWYKESRLFTELSILERDDNREFTLGT